MTTGIKNTSAARRPKPARLSGRMTSDERRRQLLDIAKALFSQKGFNGTTTKEIAARAEVAEAMIFRHFNSKDELYEAVIADKCGELCIDDYCRELKAAAARDDDQNVFETAARIVLHRYQSKRDILRILMFGILENRPRVAERFEAEIIPLRRFLADYIRKRQADGAFATANVELAVFGFTGMVTNHTMLGELVCENKKVAGDEAAVRLFSQIILDHLRKI